MNKLLIEVIAQLGEGPATDVMVKELAAQIGYDVDDLDVFDAGDYLTVTSGNDEWMVFPNYERAERIAVERVKNDLEESPEMFNQDFLRRYLYITPTDIRMISSEEATNYVEDIRDDDGGLRIVQEADLEDRWNDEGGNEALIDEAYDIVEEKYYDSSKQQLERDPVGWAEELGYEIEKEIPSFFSLDEEEAARAAVNEDGIPHFLATYDGEELELPSGAMVYRTD